jgi:hypothetical protein
MKILDVELKQPETTLLFKAVIFLVLTTVLVLVLLPQYGIQVFDNNHSSLFAIFGGSIAGLLGVRPQDGWNHVVVFLLFMSAAFVFNKLMLI